MKMSFLGDSHDGGVEVEGLVGEGLQVGRRVG